MKAVAVFPKERSLSVIDHPQPSLSAPDQVLVRMLEVGLCGTDKEIADFAYGTPPEGSPYLVLGHEGLGQVLETASKVKHLKQGDLVVPTVRRPCHEPDCPACAVGRQDFCFTGKFEERGIQKLHGFLTKTIVENETYLHRVPADLRKVAVLTEPLTIAQKALRQVFEIQDRLPWACRIPEGIPERRQVNISCRRALVLGAGPVGLLGALTFAHAGFETIVYSRLSGVEERARICEAIGCRFIAAEDVPTSELPKQLGEVDVVYEAVGASQLAFDILGLLGPNAIFIFTGVPGRKGKATVETGTIMRNLVLKNQALIGTVNAAPEDFDSAIRSLGEFQRRWPGVLERFKTGEHTVEEVPKLLLKEHHGIKSVVCFRE